MRRGRKHDVTDAVGLAGPGLAADQPTTIIVVDRRLLSFYEFLKPRQETTHGGLVVLLDRREGERRQEGAPTLPERRRVARRTTPADAARALMTVLGFAVLHRVGDRYLP